MRREPLAERVVISAVRDAHRGIELQRPGDLRDEEIGVAMPDTDRIAGFVSEVSAGAAISMCVTG